MDLRINIDPRYPPCNYNNNRFYKSFNVFKVRPVSDSKRDQDINQKRVMLRVLSGERVRTPPIWLMRQAGRYLPEYRKVRAQAGDFLTLCYTPELAAEVTLQPIRRFGFDASIVFADILLVPHALGQNVWFVTGKGPKLDPIRTVDAIPQDDPEHFFNTTEPVMETLRILRRELPDETTLIGFAGSPWTVATYMVEGGSSRDFAAVKSWALSDSDGFEFLIDRLVESTIAYLSRQVASGADVIQLFDSWAGALSESAFRKWVIGPTRRIVDGLRSHAPTTPIIGFPRGSGALYADYVAETGVDAVSLDTSVPLSWAKDALQGQCAVQGNLDPMALVTGGQGMRDEVDRICSTFSEGPFIFNLGHGIVPQTPPDHVEELISLVRGR
jgi:uroporphyrinogen decarboxylase